MTYISFNGSETTGSIAKQNLALSHPKYCAAPTIEPAQDTVNFKGQPQEKKSTFFTKLLMAASVATLAVVGLGYSHKANWVDKLKDGKFKDFMKKTDVITKPCHDLCSKIKNFFSKKS